MTPTSDIPHPPSDIHTEFAQCLAAARLTALRALLDTVNTTDDPIEKRRAATAILRISDPSVPRPPARTPRLSEPGSDRVPRHSVAGSPYSNPYQSDQASEHPNPSTYTNDQPSEPDPEAFKNIEALLAQVASEEDFFEHDDDFLDSVADLGDLPKLNIQKSAAKILATAAGQPAARPQAKSPDPPS